MIIYIYGLYGSVYMVYIWLTYGVYIYMVYWSISGLYILTLRSQVCNPYNPIQLCIYIYKYYIWNIYSYFTVTSLEFSERNTGDHPQVAV